MLEFILKPWHLIALFLASCLNREQEHIIEYLQPQVKGPENMILKPSNGDSPGP